MCSAFDWDLFSSDITERQADPPSIRVASQSLVYELVNFCLVHVVNVAERKTLSEMVQKYTYPHVHPHIYAQMFLFCLLK